MKAIIVNSALDCIDAGMRREMLDWSRALGCDTKTAKARFMLVKYPNGWHMHYAAKLQRDGHDYVEPGTNRVAADFTRVLFVGEPSWPDWFGRPLGVPEIDPADLLEALSVSDEADLGIRGAFHERERRAGQAVQA